MKNIALPHCQQCGSTDNESVSNLADTDGYTRCCNERVVEARQDTVYSFVFGVDIPVGSPKCDPEECSHD